MNAFNFKNMNREDDQELWDLLGNRQPAALSPFFARNVVRQLRQEHRWRGIVRGWFALGSGIPAAATAVILCATATFGVLHHRSRTSRGSQDDVPDVVAQIDPQDYEVVADLDDLLASQEDDSWDDTPTL